MPLKILFVCLGNICRSPIAEGLFIHLCKERGLANLYQVDSAGTGDWHIGQPPDKRSIAAAKKHGVHLPGLCRQVKASDFLEFDVIIAMDRSNRADLLADCPPPFKDKVKLMSDYDPMKGKKLDVPDPYHGGPSEFNEVYDILLRSCTCLLDNLEMAPH
jgi:protein-tyrosine phosphatase